MVQFFTPTYLETCTYEVDYRGNPRISSNYSVDKTLYRGKYLVSGLAYGPSHGIANPADSADMLNSYERIASSKFPFVYVSPECRTSRDTLRNSGFHIVRNMDNASFVLLPDMKELASFSFNVGIVTPMERIYLFTLSNELYENLKPEDYNVILDNIHNMKFSSWQKSDLQFINEADLHTQDMYSIFKCPDYKLLWEKSDTDRKFGFEKDVALVPSIEVTPELFSVWSKCKDYHVVACALAQCDYNKYPITLAYYLWQHKCNIRHYVNDSQKYILKQIGFFDLCDKGGTYNRVVEPDDWNMLQKCKLYDLGLPETGGLIKGHSANVSDIPSRIQVKPYYISEPTNFNVLINAANNM
jgi:hypothetical protein